MAYLVVFAGQVKGQGYTLKSGAAVGSANVADYLKLDNGVDSQTVWTSNTTVGGCSLWFGHEDAGPVYVIVGIVADGHFTKQVVEVDAGVVNTRVPLPEKVTKVTISRADGSDTPVGWNIQAAL